MVSNAQRVISGCIRSYITYKVGCRSIVFYFMQKILFDFHNFDAMAIFNWIKSESPTTLQIPLVLL